MENRIFMGNWSLRLEIGRFQKGIYAVEIGLEQPLVAVSHQVTRVSEFVSGVKIKTVLLISNNFFKILLLIGRAAGVLRWPSDS
jgi:hypothetical protein